MSNLNLRVELTKTPKVKVPSDKLGFGTVTTDHMLLADWDLENGWHNARIVPFGPLDVNPFCGALHYGQAIFEGLKAYNNNGKITLFRPNKNFERLNNSADRMALPKLDLDFALESLKELLKVDAEWVPSEQNTSLYIRPLMFNNEDYLGVHPAQKVTYCVMFSPSGSYFKGGLQPVKIFVEKEYVRAVKGGVGFAKTAGNYAASFKGQMKAEKHGCQQTLWLDGREHKYVEEVGAMNIFFKVNGEFLTPALSGSILPGVTRDSMLQLLKDHGQTVRETSILVDDLFRWAKTGELEEVFGTGTAAVVTPVGTLVRESENGLEEAVVADGKTGEWTEKLYYALTDIQLGKAEDKHGWVIEVCDLNQK